MNPISTRFFCAVLSMASAAGLVAFSTPSVATGARSAVAPATTLIASSAMPAHHG